MDNLTPDQRESVTQILEAGRHLLEFMNEVLDISRIESGNLSLSPEPVAVPEIVDQVVKLMRPLGATRQVDVAGAAEYVTRAARSGGSAAAQSDTAQSDVECGQVQPRWRTRHRVVRRQGRRPRPHQRHRYRRGDSSREARAALHAVRAARRRKNRHRRQRPRPCIVARARRSDGRHSSV